MKAYRRLSCFASQRNLSGAFLNQKQFLFSTKNYIKDCQYFAGYSVEVVFKLRRSLKTTQKTASKDVMLEDIELKSSIEPIFLVSLL